MTFKLFFRWTTAARGLPFAADTFLRVGRTPRPELARTDERFNAPSHALRGRYLGLLVGLDVTR